MNEFSFLTVTKEGGNPVIRRTGAAEVVPVSASPVIGAASGGVAVLPDAAGERVLRSVKVNVEPVQSGSGDPSPSNVRPISGWTGVQVTRCGKNLFDQSKMKDQAAWNIIPFYAPPGTQLCMSTNQPASGTSGLLMYFSLNGSQAQEYLLYDGKPVKFTVPNGGTVSIIQRNRDGITSFSDYWYQIESGLTATEYEPYEGNVFEVEFPSEAGTVYGGVLDLTAGTLTVDKWYAVYDGSENWYTNGDPSGGVIRYYLTGQIPAQGANITVDDVESSIAKKAADGQTLAVAGTFAVRAFASTAGWVGFAVSQSLYPTATEFKAMLASLAQNNTPAQVVAKTITKTTYQLTPVQIAALAGLNNVWADCGPVEVEWVRDTGAAIDAANADTRAMIGEVSGETASRSLAVGEYVTVGDKLYRVTSAVGAGETLTPGSNVAETTVGAELSRLSAMIAPR